jgi:hypothetical protein
LWVLAAVTGACYGVFLAATALRLPSRTELTGQFTLPPAVKALTAVLLAVAVLTHAVGRERRWLLPALVFSALFPLASRSGRRLTALFPLALPPRRSCSSPRASSLAARLCRLLHLHK